MFLVDLQFIRPLTEVDHYVAAHRDYLSQFYANGSLLLGGRKVPRTGGIILSRQQTLDDVKALFDADPMVAGGVASYSILEFSPVMMQKELQSLL